MLPPGRARLSTRWRPTGSPVLTKTIGIEAVARFSAATCCEQDVGLERDQFGSQPGVALRRFNQAPVEHKIAALHVAESTQFDDESIDPICQMRIEQQSYPVNSLGLGPSGSRDRQRGNKGKGEPKGTQPGGQADHSITSSAHTDVLGPARPVYASPCPVQEERGGPDTSLAASHGAGRRMP